MTGTVAFLTTLLAASGSGGHHALNRHFAAAKTGGPVIASIAYSPTPIPITGAFVSVSAKVTDTSSKIQSVYLYELKPGNSGNYRSAQMVVASDGVTYKASITVDPNTNNSSDGETLYIQVVDNASVTVNSTVAVQGYSNTAPSISAVTYSPSPIPILGATVKVTAKVTDSVGLSSVYLYETKPGNSGNYRSAPMTVGSDGVTYSASITVDFNSNNSANGEYLYIQATDTASNVSTVGVATQGYSNVAPAVSAVRFSPDPIPINGATVTVSASVSDPVAGLASVTLYEVRPGYSGNYRSAPMTVGTNGLTYTASISVDPNPNTGSDGESLYLLAIDNAGNQTNYPITTQGYANTPPTGSLPLLASSNASVPVLSPSAVFEGGAEFTLTINGTNFAAGAYVLFNGVMVKPTTINSTQILVNIPPSLISKAGYYAISVLNPTPSGVSNSVNFMVY